MTSSDGKQRFRQISPPTTEELQALLHSIVHRVARYLERQGLLECDVENSYLALENLGEDAVAMPDLYGHSITYRDGTTHVIFGGAAIRRWISWRDWQRLHRVEEGGGDRLLIQKRLMNAHLQSAIPR